jgi:hypothetical protein
MTPGSFTSAFPTEKVLSCLFDRGDRFDPAPWAGFRAGICYAETSILPRA